MTLEQARAAVGRLVVYRPDPNRFAHEEGVITSVNDRWVFVRYGTQQTSQATDPRHLEPAGWT